MDIQYLLLLQDHRVSSGGTFDGHWGNLIMALILWLFAVAIWPVFIRKWAEKGTDS